MEEIDRQLRASDSFVVFLSEESIRSDMVRQEVETALELRNQGELAIDLRHPIEADPDLLVEEDTEPPLLEIGAKPLRELLVRGDVPVAEEDLAHSSTKD